jgi:hypothetical protein
MACHLSSRDPQAATLGSLAAPPEVMAGIIAMTGMGGLAGYQVRQGAARRLANNSKGLERDCTTDDPPCASEQ